MQTGLSSTPTPLEPKGRVLFIDDDADVLKAAELLLRRHGLSMTAARSPAQSWSALATAPADVVLLDLNFTRGATSGEEGFKHLAEIMAHDPQAVVVVVTGHSGINIAVAAMRAGASDFVMKPWSNERLIATLNAAVALRASRRLASSTEPGEEALILGDSPAIQRARDLIARAAPTDASVLIYGAAGVGKSLMARVLHRQSRRASGPYVPIDLSAASEQDLQPALYAALDQARGGTLFLDEIGALPPALQAGLLAALERRRDVRIAAATRRRREDVQGRGGVQADLLYRLNTVEIFAPSLKERGGDALVLAEHFLRLFAARYGRPAKPLAPDAAQAIAASPWPGEVRALRQAMERCVIFSTGERYEQGDLTLTEAAPASPVPSPSNLADRNLADLNLVRSERALVEAALKRNGFNVSHAAQDLGLTRAALYRRMAKYGL